MTCTVEAISIDAEPFYSTLVRRHGTDIMTMVLMYGPVSLGVDEMKRET